MLNTADDREQLCFVRLCLLRSSVLNSVSSVPSVSSTKRGHQSAREIGTEPLLFVLEIDEDIRQAEATNRVRPSLDVRLLIALIAQAEVAIVGGHFYGCVQFLAVGDT